MRVNCHQQLSSTLSTILIFLILIDCQQFVISAPPQLQFDNHHKPPPVSTIKKSEPDLDPGSIFSAFFPKFDNVIQELNLFGFPILTGQSKGHDKSGSSDQQDHHQHHPLTRLHVVNDDVEPQNGTSNTSHIPKDIKEVLAELNRNPETKEITLHKHSAKVIGRGHLRNGSDGLTHFVPDYNPFPVMPFYHPVHRHLLILHGNMAEHDNKSKDGLHKDGHSKPDEWTLDHMLSFIKSKKPLQLHDVNLAHEDTDSHQELNKKWTQQEVYALIHLLEKLFRSTEMVEGNFSWDQFVRDALPWPGPLSSKWQSLCLEPGIKLQQLQSNICNPMETKDKQNWCPPGCSYPPPTSSPLIHGSSDGPVLKSTSKVSGQGKLISKLVEQQSSSNLSKKFTTLTTRSIPMNENSESRSDKSFSVTTVPSLTFDATILSPNVANLSKYRNPILMIFTFSVSPILVL